MSIISMTGIGQYAQDFDWGRIKVHIQSVNHRYFEVKTYLPAEFISVELEIKDLIREKISRGKLTLKLEFEEKLESLTPEIEAKSEEIYKILQQLKQKYGFKDEITLQTLLMIPWMDKNIVPIDPSEKWNEVRICIDNAIDDLIKMKIREGATLAQDMQVRLETMTRSIVPLQQQSAENVNRQLTNLNERLKKLRTDTQVDESRLAQEVLLYVDKSDYTEELVRLQSHVEQFLKLIDHPEPTGRKLNFLLQEMNREANTLGSKTDVAELAHIVVNIKDEIEKLREQIQNVE